MIYHITSRAAWTAAQAAGAYTAPSLASEGFIHCSQLSQVIPVANNFYKGQVDLCLLIIDETRLTALLKWEPPSGGAPPPGVAEGELFPHVFGVINVDAVVNVAGLDADAAGVFHLPKAL
jgi:uncharacterized protein (DUF952 family)